MITAVSIMGIIAVAVTSFMIVSYYLNRLKQARARARAKARARAMSKFRAIKAFSSIGGARGLAFAVPKGSGGGVAGALGELKALQVSEPQLADEETKVVPFEKKLPKPDYLANFDPAAAAAARLAEAQKAVEETREARQRSKRDLAEQSWKQLQIIPRMLPVLDPELAKPPPCASAATQEAASDAWAKFQAKRAARAKRIGSRPESRQAAVLDAFSFTSARIVPSNNVSSVDPVLEAQKAIEAAFEENKPKSRANSRGSSRGMAASSAEGLSLTGTQHEAVDGEGEEARPRGTEI